jgi:hypothetical protein
VTSLDPSITVEGQKNVRHFLTTVEMENKNGKQLTSDEK